MRSQWLRRPAQQVPLPRFGPVELEEVEDGALELAVQAGMEQERAELLAFRVVDRLGGERFRRGIVLTGQRLLFGHLPHSPGGTKASEANPKQHPTSRTSDAN